MNYVDTAIGLQYIVELKPYSQIDQNTSDHKKLVIIKKKSSDFFLWQLDIFLWLTKQSDQMVVA